MTAIQHGESVVVSGLKRKRAEVVGIIAELEKQIAAHRVDLSHIDRVLRLMDPKGEIDEVRKAKPRNTGHFAHSELSRRVYDALRQGSTVSAAELADKAITDKGIEAAQVRAEFISKFLVRLAQMTRGGQIERIRRGNGVRWRLAGEVSAPPALPLSWRCHTTRERTMNDDDAVNALTAKLVVLEAIQHSLLVEQLMETDAPIASMRDYAQRIERSLVNATPGAANALPGMLIEAEIAQQFAKIEKWLRQAGAQ
jgi:hypothetical protein